MPKDKNHLPIERLHDVKKGIIIYEMQDKRLTLPAYRKVAQDGIKVHIVLNNGETKWLPDLDSGYRFKEANNWQIVFEKK